MRIPFVACLLLSALPLAAQLSFTLHNGLQVRLRPDHDRPYVELRLEVAWPRGEEAPGREGSAGVLARVLQTGGAGPHDRASFDRILEERGIAFGFHAGPGRFNWNLRCTSMAQEEAFALLAHAVSRPVFSGSNLEAQRARLWRERQALGLAEWAELRFQWDLLEERPEGLTTERSLSELSLDNLISLHRRLVRPERAVLHLRGDLNAAQARQLALLHLGVWGPAPEPPLQPAPKAAPRSAAAAACLAVAQGSPQATLALLQPVAPRPEHAELLAALLPRWLEGAEPPAAKAELRWLADGRPMIWLRLSGSTGDDPAALLLVLRGWAEKLRNRTVTAADLAHAIRLQASLNALQQPPKGPEAQPPPSSKVTPEDLMELLRTWCAPARQRALLTGALEIPKEHPARKDLGPFVWIRSKE